MFDNYSKGMKQRIWLSLAHMGGQEQKFIKEAFDTNWIVPLGPNVDGFEKELEICLSERNENLNRKNYVVALSSGTAAIHLALVQAGVKAGDEVICQSFTFIASANPVIYQFAKPVFVDSEKDTWNMDPVKMEEAIIDRKEKTGSYPKAIVPVHLGMNDINQEIIRRMAKEDNIRVVEDAAEALGS